MILIVDGVSGLPDMADMSDLPLLLQVRDKQAPARGLLERVRVLKARGLRVLVNDRLDVALAAGADGVHLPEDGLPVAAARSILPAGMLLSAAAHTPEAAAAKARQGADLILLAPIWEGHGPAIGLAALAAAARETDAPVFALGGVTTVERAREARAAGAYGVATIRGAAAARTLLEAVR